MTKTTIDTTDMRKSFHKIYYDEIAPVMENYEKERRRKLFIIYIIEIVLITLLVICAKAFWNSIMNRFDTSAMLFIFASLACLGGILGIPVVQSCNFAKELKNNCMDKILKAFGDIEWYNAKNKLNSYLPETDYDYSQSSLFSSYNRESCDDTFSGTYKGVKFSIIETHLWYESGSGKNRTCRHVFKGVIIRFDANKPIKNNTIIATKGDENIKNRWFTRGSLLITLLLFGLGLYFNDFEIIGCSGISLVLMIGSIWHEKFSKDKTILREIKLEDPEFNKRYRAYSSNEVEGRYLITTAFMERFNNIKTAFGARGAKCSFYGDNLMFAITTGKNLFEVGNLFTSLNKPKQLQKFMNELISIFALVDYFKLDEKTGL